MQGTNRFTETFFSQLAQPDRSPGGKLHQRLDKRTSGDTEGAGMWGHSNLAPFPKSNLVNVHQTGEFSSASNWFPLYPCLVSLTQAPNGPRVPGRSLRSAGPTLLPGTGQRASSSRGTEGGDGEARTRGVVCAHHCLYDLWLWVKNRYPKWNPGKWNQGLNKKRRIPMRIQKRLYVSFGVRASFFFLGGGGLPFG